MSNSSTEIVVGMDMSDKKSEICILNGAGEIVDRGQVINDLDSLSEFFSRFSDPSGVLVAMEAGTHSPWVSCHLADLGFEVLVGNPRKVRAIYASERKNDRKDAEMIARISRFDRKLFYPIKHRGKRSQAMLAVLKARDVLVKSRVQLVGSIRGMLKSMGVVISTSSPSAFAKKALREIPDEYHFGLLESLTAISQLDDSIKAYDKKITAISKEHFPETKTLSAIKGVGPITSLAFVLIIEDHKRFKRSRDVGSYLGLVPKQDQSGEVDKQLGISKTGNQLMRRLLVQSAHYIMGPFGEDCDLRRFGERLLARGGTAAKQKAITAVARKLAVKMHSMWAKGTTYKALYTEQVA